jgi:ATP-dependent DNA helicase RecG
MRNTFKYTKLYSNQFPQFIEGDVFRAVVPLNEIATGRVGPQVDVTVQDKTQDEVQDRVQVKEQVGIQDDVQVIQNKILEYCVLPRSKTDIASHCGYKSIRSFTRIYLNPLLVSGLMQMTIPDKPTSRNQRYITASF